MPDASGRVQGEIGWDPTTDPAVLEWLAGVEAWKRDLRAKQEAEKAARKREPRKRNSRAKAPGIAPGGHRGETDGRCKITEDDVRSIRRRSAGGENRLVLAHEFGISCRSVNLICSRRRWAHVPD